MASYSDQLSAMANNLSKAFGGERGVLTNVDVQRWVNAMKKPGDTVEVKNIKDKALKRLADAAFLAQRRAISGDPSDFKKTRTDLHSKINDILKPVEEAERKQAQGRPKSKTMQGQEPPKISSDEEWEKLEKGAYFYGPDGKLRTK
jgi:hypothetical protein